MERNTTWTQFVLYCAAFMLLWLGGAVVLNAVTGWAIGTQWGIGVFTAVVSWLLYTRPPQWFVRFDRWFNRRRRSH